MFDEKHVYQTYLLDILSKSIGYLLSIPYQTYLQNSRSLLLEGSIRRIPATVIRLPKLSLFDVFVCLLHRVFTFALIVVVIGYF